VSAGEDENEGGVPLADKKQQLASTQDNAVTARLQKTKMCYFFEKGKCANQRCRYAHSAAELAIKPDLQKTKLCKAFGQTGVCGNGENCVFAHGEAELRVTDGIYKTQMCHFYERGRCLKGDRCNHAHGTEDLRSDIREQLEGTARTTTQRPTTNGGATAGSGSGNNASVDASSARWQQSLGDAQIEGQIAKLLIEEQCRQPLGPLPLSELLADFGSSASMASGDALNTIGDVFHQSAYGYPACHWNDCGASFPGAAAMSNDAAAASVAMAALGGLSLAPLENLQNLGLSPLVGAESPFWNQWPPTGTSYDHPATPNPYSASPFQTPGGNASTTSPAIPSPQLCQPTPSPTPGVRYDESGLAGLDLEKRLASLDVVVRDLASEARDFSAASVNEQRANEQRVVHRI
jgi:hypothetical protein